MEIDGNQHFVIRAHLGKSVKYLKQSCVHLDHETPCVHDFRNIKLIKCFHFVEFV